MISKIKLKNYRNYDNLELTLNSNLNIIIGDNAQGKTNILESIYVLALTKSFLTTSDKNLVKFNNEFCSIESTLDNLKKVKIVITDKTKKIIVNNKEVKKYSDYISTLKVIIFSPDNLKIVKDGPSARRKFLNTEISQLSNKYLCLLNRYNMLLKQRNDYLKKNQVNNNCNFIYLSSINELLSDIAVEICYMRKDFIDDINKYISAIYREITNDDNMTVKYLPNIDIKDTKEETKNVYLDKLNQSFEKELKYGMTLYGIHRDDFIFCLNDLNLSLYGSQGQMKTAILSLKLAEIDVFQQLSVEKPILLLDDIFSELDLSKRNNLIKYLTNDIQIIMTTTDINLIDEEILKSATLFEIENGKVL